MENYKSGEYLRKLREAKKLSQFQLGKLVGVSDKAVSKWENGYSRPKANILIKLSEILSVSAEELLINMFYEE